MNKYIKNAGIVMIFLSIIAINIASIGDKPASGLSGKPAMILLAVDPGGGTSGGGTSGGGTGTGSGTDNSNGHRLLPTPYACPSGYEDRIKCMMGTVLHGDPPACTSANETPCPNCTTPGHDWITESSGDYKYCKRCNVRVPVSTNTTGTPGCSHVFTSGSVQLAKCSKPGCSATNTSYCPFQQIHLRCMTYTLPEVLTAIIIVKTALQHSSNVRCQMFKLMYGLP